jgi:hypothetical protein
MSVQTRHGRSRRANRPRKRRLSQPREDHVKASEPTPTIGEAGGTQPDELTFTCQSEEEKDNETVDGLSEMMDVDDSARENEGEEESEEESENEKEKENEKENETEKQKAGRQKNKQPAKEQEKEKGEKEKRSESEKNEGESEKGKATEQESEKEKDEENDKAKDNENQKDNGTDTQTDTQKRPAEEQETEEEKGEEEKKNEGEKNESEKDNENENENEADLQKQPEQPLSGVVVSTMAPAIRTMADQLVTAQTTSTLLRASPVNELTAMHSHRETFRNQTESRVGDGTVNAGNTRVVAYAVEMERSWDRIDTLLTNQLQQVPFLLQYRSALVAAEFDIATQHPPAGQTERKKEARVRRSDQAEIAKGKEKGCCGGLCCGEMSGWIRCPIPTGC